MYCRVYETSSLRSVNQHLVQINFLIKLITRGKREVLRNALVDGFVDCGLEQTLWTRTSR